MRDCAVAPPSAIIRSASLRDASTNVTSFIRSSAWSGELVRVSSTAHCSRLGEAKFIMNGAGTGRFPQVERRGWGRAATLRPPSPATPRGPPPRARRLIGLDRRAADLFGEQSGDREGLVANHL